MSSSAVSILGMSNRFRKWTLPVLAIGLVAASHMLRADDHDRDHDDDDDQPTSRAAVSLHEEMEAMGRDFRTIRSQVNDPARNVTTLAAVIDLEQHTVLAKSVLPRSATTSPTTQGNAEKTQDYQALMINLLRTELELEEQLRANDNPKAVATVASLHDLETSGHQEFRPRHGHH